MALAIFFYFATQTDPAAWLHIPPLSLFPFTVSSDKVAANRAAGAADMPAGGNMTLGSARWLGLSYFTYFFCYGIYLIFWSGWLKGVGLEAEKSGLLLGCGRGARVVGSLVIA